MSHGYAADEQGLGAVRKFVSALFAAGLFVGINALLLAGVFDMVNSYGAAYALTATDLARASAPLPVVKVVADRSTECARAGSGADKPT